MKQLFLFLILAQVQSASETIVVTASSVEESLATTPAAVTIVTRADIEKRQARDVADLLREVPGLAVARTGSPGKIGTLFIRGGSSKQALVLWNGVEMNNPYLSGYNFGQLSTAGVEKVEIIRGPYSALYGSDAVSGVVNVLTAPARSGLQVTLAGGEKGLWNGLISGAWRSGTWTAHGSAELRRDDGFAPNDDFSGDTYVAGAGYAPNDSFSIGVSARRNGYRLGIPRNIGPDFMSFVPTPNRREEGSETQILVPIRFARGRLKYDVRFADSRRDERFRDPDGAFGPESGFTDAKNRSVRATVQSATAFGTFTLGGEAERAEVDHEDTFGLDVRSRSRDSRSFFVEDRFSARGVEIAAGARYDHFDTFGSRISPRLAVAYVRGDRKWRAAFGAGFRAPAIGELYAPFFGNADLHAELSQNFEIGFDQYLRGAMLSLTAFRSDYDDLIAFDGPTQRFGNIDRAESYGIELGAARTFDRLRTAISYTWLRATDRATGERLLRRPQHAGSASVGYDFRPFAAEVVVIHSGARPDVTDLFPFGVVTNKAYTIADLTLRYDAGGYAPFVKIENATNVQYEEVFGYPSAGRRALIGIRYTLR
jgi:vitamin B12 transporter